MGRSAGPFLQTSWTVSVPMNLASVVEKSHLLTFKSDCSGVVCTSVAEVIWGWGQGLEVTGTGKS